MSIASTVRRHVLNEVRAWSPVHFLLELAITAILTWLGVRMMALERWEFALVVFASAVIAACLVVLLRRSTSAPEVASAGVVQQPDELPHFLQEQQLFSFLLGQIEHCREVEGDRRRARMWFALRSTIPSYLESAYGKPVRARFDRTVQDAETHAVDPAQVLATAAAHVNAAVFARIAKKLDQLRQTDQQGPAATASVRPPDGRSG